MNRKTDKNLETEKYVDKYFEDNGVMPSYGQIAEHFKIGKGSAHARCRKFRDKMDKFRFAKTIDGDFTKFKIEYLVPAKKVEEFLKLLNKINDLMK